MATAHTPNETRGQRWIWISLLVGFVLVIGLFAFVFQQRMRIFAQWQFAVDPVEQLGGHVAWHSNFRSDPSMTTANDIVAAVNLNNSTVTDPELKILHRYPNLVQLTLRSTAVGDDGIEHLACLRSVTYLDLRNSQVTPAGVERLREALPDCGIRY